MSSQNSIHHLSISFFSPVHIGSGEEMTPLEYLIDPDGYFYTFSLDQVIAAMTPQDRQRLIELQRSDKPGSLTHIRNLIRHRFDKGKHIVKIPVTPAVQSYYQDKISQTDHQLITNPFIKTMNRPYIPGTSLKGAMRTAVLNHWAGEGDKDENDILKLKTRGRDNRLRPDIGLDVFKFLKVPDIHLPPDFTFYAKISLYNLKDNALNETKIPLIREVTASHFFHNGPLIPSRPHAIAFTLKLDEHLMKDRRTASGRRDLTFSVLWHALDFYKEVLDKESRKWSAYNENLKQFYDRFTGFLQTAGDRGEVKVIKLGFGSGFEAVTITRLRDNSQPHGKSVHLVEGLCPLGWAVLQKEKQVE